MSQENNSPWSDPNVKAALKGGRTPDDVYLIDCPNCGLAGYYNQGTHFTCRVCEAGYAVVADEEELLERPSINVDEAYPLSDYEAFDPEEI